MPRKEVEVHEFVLVEYCRLIPVVPCSRGLLVYGDSQVRAGRVSNFLD